MPRQATEKYVKADGADLGLFPFSGRARPVVQYSVYAYIGGMAKAGPPIKIGLAERCGNHPQRFAARTLDGGQADILNVTPGTDGCVKLGDAARALWTAHLDHEPPQP